MHGGEVAEAYTLGKMWGARCELRTHFWGTRMTLQTKLICGCFVATGGFLGVLGSSRLVHAQSSARKPATFTAAQAAKGKTAYAKNCASCHGQGLSGSEFAGGLNGTSFGQQWS